MPGPWFISLSTAFVLVSLVYSNWRLSIYLSGSSVLVWSYKAIIKQLMLSAGLKGRSNRTCLKILLELSSHSLIKRGYSLSLQLQAPQMVLFSANKTKQGNELSSLPFSAARPLSSWQVNLVNVFTRAVMLLFHIPLVTACDHKWTWDTSEQYNEDPVCLLLYSPREYFSTW